MFLDEKLYQHTNKQNLRNSNDFKMLVNELYLICENHWKPKFSLNEDVSHEIAKALKIELDTVFNSWDLFIKRLTKEEYFLIKYLSKVSYKSAFMGNAKLKKIYDELPK